MSRFSECFGELSPGHGIGGWVESRCRLLEGHDSEWVKNSQKNKQTKKDKKVNIEEKRQSQF